MTLELISSILAFLYAAILMTILLGVKPIRLPKAKKCIYFIGMLLIVLASSTVMLLFGVDSFAKYYSLFGQLPGVVGFYFVCRHNVTKIIFVMLTAIFLMLPGSLMGLVCNEVLMLPMLGTLAVMVLTYAALILFVWRVIRPNFVYVLDYFGTKDILKFCIVPLSYTLLTYYIDGFALQLESIPMRCFLFVSTLSVYIIIMDMFRRTREMQRLQSEKDVMSVQLEASGRYLETLKRTQQQTIAYRHDMRHHLSLISACLATGNVKKIESYLSDVQSDLSMISPQRFCENETVNLVLCSFASKAQSCGVALSLEVHLPQTLPVPETELCALLSNGLENAVTAAAQMEEASLKKVQVHCKISDNRLLISIENNYTGTVLIENGIPQTRRDGHGFGTKSIVSIAAKHNGYCAYEAVNGIFTLRLALPLDC